MSQGGPEQVARIVWIGNLTTPLVLGIIGQFVIAKDPPAQFVTPTVLAVLVLVGVALLGLGFRIRGWIRGGAGSAESGEPGANLAQQVVPWAIFEAVAILGFVAVLGGAPVQYFWLFAVFSWVGLMLTRP
ncbi:MAG: hypothetical protein Kow00109_22640 [Acidobacteriota bacterium]